MSEMVVVFQQNGGNALIKDINSGKTNVHQQPAHRPKTEYWPCTTNEHQELTNQLATLHLKPAHQLKS